MNTQNTEGVPFKICSELSYKKNNEWVEPLPKKGTRVGKNNALFAL